MSSRKEALALLLGMNKTSLCILKVPEEGAQEGRETGRRRTRRARRKHGMTE